MPHGDFSDIAALILIAGGLQQMFVPHFAGIGPLKGNFDSSSPELASLIHFCGGFMLTVGFMLTTVRWNPINGKLSGLGCLSCGINMAYTAFKTLDGGVFVPRLCYVYAGVMALAGLHIALNPNPMIKADEKKK